MRYVDDDVRTIVRLYHIIVYILCVTYSSSYYFFFSLLACHSDMSTCAS